ncbi:hypothetical protein VNO78_20007 [Psophocarpus tetragonolobus]|uniref:Uncharacterized protein n=1 Tax=Psophocarpus tetragonolobus TaxID=3891 RepID=A0AAN9S9K5_PSOTE
MVKDQTYFLSHLSQSQLKRLLFPLGCIPKGNRDIVVDEPEVTSDNFYGRAYLLAMPLDMAMRKMLETLDDPFTRFLEPEKFRSYLTKTDMQASGLVISASPGGPVYRAGGSSGDVILETDDTSIDNMGLFLLHSTCAFK